VIGAVPAPIFKPAAAMLAFAVPAIARSQPAHMFAAPEAAGAAATGTAGHMLQMTLALLLVLALVFGLAWFSRRMRAAVRPGGHSIEVLAQAALGTKERAVLVKVGSAQILLGVAAGNVRTLHLLSASEMMTSGPQATENAAPAALNFADLLRRSLGRS
jgi:flagellar protein FliO/FliZ